MTPVLNEKVMAGLGRDLPKTGALAKEGVEASIKALKRFAALLEAGEVESVFPVATAAVREAKDGRAFAQRIKDETGFDLRILDGADEARLSALGSATANRTTSSIAAYLAAWWRPKAPAPMTAAFSGPDSGTRRRRNTTSPLADDLTVGVGPAARQRATDKILPTVTV